MKQLHTILIWEKLFFRLVPRLAALLFILTLSIQSHAQVKIGDNPNSINPSSLLELESTNKAFTLPRLSNVQMNAVSTPASGMMVYNTDSAWIYCYNGTQWITMRGMSAWQIINLISDNAKFDPLVDSVWNAMKSKASSLIAGSGAITVTDGAASTFRDVIVDVNRDSLISYILNNPWLRDSVIKIVADSANSSPLRDSIFRTVSAQGRNASGSSPIVISGGIGATLETMNVRLDSAALAVVISQSPTRDTILSIVSENAKNLTAGSGAVVVTGGIGATLTNVTVDVNKDSLASYVFNSPILIDSIIRVVADSANSSPLRDSIFRTVTAQGKNLTASSGALVVTGGIGTTLQNTTIDVNRDSLASYVFNNPILIDSIIRVVADSANSSPLRDSIFSTVAAQGKNATGSSPIVITGGAGATLQTLKVSLDSAALAVVVSQSPVRDTVLSIVSQNGKDLTAGSGAVNVTGGVGSTLKNVTVDVNRDSLISVVMNSPLLADSIIEIVADNSGNSPLRDSIFSTVAAQGRNLTAGSGAVTVTGGVGATLKNVTVEVNRDSLISVVINSPILSDSIIEIIADNSGKSPLRDSIFSTVTAQGRNMTGSSPIVVTGGAGAALENVSVSLDSSALAVVVSQSPVRDTILRIVSESGKNLSAGSGAVTVIGGTGATLKNVTVDVERDTLINIIATNSNKSPLRDSIYSSVVEQSKTLSSTTPVLTITGGANTTLKNTSVNIDSIQLLDLILRSHLIDSITAASRGFNAYGTTTANSFLTLTLALSSSPDIVSAYQLQQLSDTTTFPSFNQGIFNNGDSSYFQAPVTGMYSLTYTATLVLNPSLLSLGGTYTWGIAIIKENGTPTIIQTSRTSQVISATVLGVVGASTASSNTITTLVKLNAGDKVSVGVGAANGISLGLVSSTSLNMRFSGFLVR